jgi:glucose/arabinose dehydrogenase
MRAGVRVFGDVRLRWVLILALLMAPMWIVRAMPVQAFGATVPDGFIDELVAQANQPTGLTFTPDGRMVVIGKLGQVWVYKDDVFLGQAVDLAPQICSEWERGLVGVTLDPDFGVGNNRTIYLFYTHNTKGVCPLFNDPNRAPISDFPENRVSKFRLEDNNTINPASEVVILDHIPSMGIHNSGHLAFGPVDKLLYVAVGDGGCTYPDMLKCQSGNNNARRGDLLFGKILRLNKDGSIPASNPYAGDPDVRRCGDPAGVPPGTGRCGETFANGLRNPFRFAFKPGTQDLYINDVGNNAWEEIDLNKAGVKGADYGWNIREGHCKMGSTTDCQASDGSTVNGLTNPIFDYHHDTGCSSIVGGAFVPNGIWGAPYSGSYLFADFVCGKILRLAPKSGGGYQMIPFVEGLGSSSAVHIEFGPYKGTQALYYTTFEENDGVHRISKGDPNDLPPTASFTASPTAISAPPAVVNFDGSGSTDPDNDPLQYQWDFGDGSSDIAAVPTTTHTYTQKGAYNATLRVKDDARLSAPFSKLIEVGSPPAPSIVSPSTSAKFKINDLVTLTGAASDPDGTLSDANFSWTVIRHHNDTHTHPFLGPVTGKTLSFYYPEPEDLDAARLSRLEAFLTVTDSNGISRTVARDINPVKVMLTVNDNRSEALRVYADTMMFQGTGTFASWPGYRFQLFTPSPQQFPDYWYKFKSWSDGGPQTHDVVTPSANTTYTANFDKFAGTAPSPPPPPPPPPAPTGVMGIARTAGGYGYWLASDKGKVQAFGNASHFGDTSTIALNKPIVGIASTPSGHGYWLVATDGGVFSFGDAQFWGSTGNMTLNQPVVGMASTPTGKGYWLVATDGGVFTFGDAQFWGSTGAMKLNKPVVGMDRTPTGNGYWLVAADGGIFTFGDAPYKGSTGAQVLNKPVVNMESTGSGQGYWLMASDGGIFTFGDAPFYGSTGGFPPASSGSGMAATPDGAGYWLAFLDSTVANFGSAPHF